MSTTDDTALLAQLARAIKAGHDAYPTSRDDLRDEHELGAAAVLPIIREREQAAALEALDGLETDTAQVIRTMRDRGEQGWARYAIANDILDNHRTRFYPKETP